MIAFWKRLLEELDAGRPVFAALVVASSAHSPGTAGARMLVFGDGGQWGTVGGGIMEAGIVREGRAALERGEPMGRVETLYHRDDVDGPRSGLICAGRQTNLYRIMDPRRDRDAVAAVVRLVEARAAGWVAMTPEAIRVTGAPQDPGEPRYRLTVDGADWTYTEQLLPLRHLTIFGGGHCGLALSDLAAGLGYLVTVIEERENVPTVAANRSATHIHRIDDFRGAAPLLPYPALTRAVVMTAAMPGDVRALTALLPLPLAFVGLMGSAAKIAAIYDQLRATGFSDSDLDRIDAPVGVPMRSNTPQEIAVSIAARLLQLDDGGDSGRVVSHEAKERLWT